MKKVEDRRIAHVTKRFGAIRRVCKKLRERKDRDRPWLLDERVERIAEDILHARTPRFSPESFENMDDVRHDEAALLLAAAVEHVERECAVLILGIEIDNVVRPVPGD